MKRLLVKKRFGIVRTPSGAISSVNFIDEDFEGSNTVYPAGWSGIGAAAMHSTVSPLAGAQSMRLPADSQYHVFSLAQAGDDITIDFQFRFDIDSPLSFFNIYDSSFSTVAQLYINTGRVATLTSGSISLTTTALLPLNTPIWVRLRFKKGSGSNSEAELYWSTSSTLPPQGDATHYCGATNGNVTTQANIGLIACGTLNIDVDNLQVTTVAQTRVVVCDGDSITAGNHPTDSWPKQLQDTLGTNYRVFNVGVSAQRLDAMILDQYDEYLRYFDVWNRTAKPIVVIWEYINQAGIEVDGAAIEAKIAQICTTARAAGFYVIACTDFHYSATPGSAARCRAASDLVRTNYTAYADALAELDLQSLRDDSTAFGDDIHLTTAGWAIVAGVIDDLILAAP